MERLARRSPHGGARMEEWRGQGGKGGREWRSGEARMEGPRRRACHSPAAHHSNAPIFHTFTPIHTLLPPSHTGAARQPRHHHDPLT